MPASEGVEAWQEIERTCPALMDPEMFATRVQPIVDKVSTDRNLFPKGPSAHAAAGEELTKACNQWGGVARAAPDRCSALHCTC